MVDVPIARAAMIPETYVHAGTAGKDHGARQGHGHYFLGMILAVPAHAAE